MEVLVFEKRESGESVLIQGIKEKGVGASSAEPLKTGPSSQS
jgi:hypothetical protein